MPTVRARRRRFPVLPVVIAAGILFVIAGALLAYWLLAAGQPAQADGVPPAASKAGKPIAGEAYDWRPVAIGGGGFITGMSADRTGKTRVVRTDVYGAYIWNEAGNRWAQLVTASAMPADMRFQASMNEGVYEIAVAPSDAKRIYMVIKGRIYRSDDRGLTFTAPARGAPFPAKFFPNSKTRLRGPFMAVSPDDPNLLFLGTPEAGLWRSTDGAMSWTKVGSVPDAIAEAGSGAAIWFEPKKGGRVFVASPGHGLSIADSATGTFRAASSDNAGPTTISRGAFAANGAFYASDLKQKRFFVYRDGKWNDLTAATPSPLPSKPYLGVAVDPGNGYVYAVDEGGQAYCSADGAGGWQHLLRRSEPGQGDPPWLHVTDRSYFASGQVMFDPVVPHRLWVASGTGPYYADLDNHCSQLVLKSQVRGIEELVANDAVQPPGHAPLFANWDFGIHVKPDLNAFSTTYGPRERVLIAAQQMDWSPSNPSFLVTNASDTLTSCCWQDGNSVLAGYSMDGGLHWTKFPTLPTPPGTKPDDPWRMSFGTIAVSADSTDNIVWEPAYNRSPFYTLDRGKSWSRVVLPGEVLPNTGSYKQFYGTRKTLAADRVTPGTFYLMHGGEAPNGALAGLWRTSDGGRSWTRVYSGEIAPNVNMAAKLRAVPGKAGNLFFTSSAGYGADTRLRRSTDGGTSWTALDGVDHVDDVAFGKAAPGAGYPTIFVSGQAHGQYGVWRSIDNAASWQKVADFPLGRLDQVSAIEADKDVFGRVYLGYTGSAWLYGEPAPCKPVPEKTGDDRACVAVGAAAR